MYDFDLLEFRLSTLFSYRVAAVRHVHGPLDANGKNRPKAVGKGLEMKPKKDRTLNGRIEDFL